MTDCAKTIVEYFAEHERYRCGYCGNTDTNFSHGMWAHTMNVQDYQDLLDRGWRRSGKYTYKPTMNMTCCPQYTIRCEVQNFKLRKSHKKVLKKVNKYLIHGIKPKTEEKGSDQIEGASGSGSMKEQRLQQKSSINCEVEESVESKPQIETNQLEMSEGNPGISDSAVDSGGGSKEHSQSLISTKQPKPGSGQDPAKPPCKKAKEIRKERKLAKLSAKGVTANEKNQETRSSKQPEPKTVEDFINEPSKAENCAHRLEIRLVRSHPKSQEFKSSLTESFNVYKKYQMTIHKDTPSECSLSNYTNFLVDSPLEEEHKEGGIPDGYGSFHQQYILDGKIICVGVLDILPSLVSSKYLYYDPDYNFLSLGTYSALQEIAFIQNLNRYSKEMKYYYMGFYIHSCPKMKYKGQYFPSYLLCPETYTWHPVEQCAPKLDQQKYCRFADSNTVDVNGPIDLSSVLILFSRQLMTYQIYKAFSRGKNEDEDEVKEYANFVGKKCSQRVLLFRK